jgi:hypothetical protein
VIESNEPKDGDFVTYVEKMVRLPEGMRLPSNESSPGEVDRRGSVRKWAGLARPESARQPRTRHETDAQKASKLAELAGGSAQAWGRSVGALLGDKGDAGSPAGGVDHARDDVFAQSPGQDRRSAASRRLRAIDAEEAARIVAKLVARLGSLMVIAGIALLAMSFADRPFFAVDPVAGVGLTAMGAVFRRLAGKVA